GHVVHMLGQDDISSQSALFELYQPNTIVRCRGADAEIDNVHTRALGLHADLAILLSTSGSTGSRKLVKISYENIEANTRSIVDYLNMDAADIGLTLLKPNYSYGLSVINTHIAVGGGLRLTNRSVQDPGVWQDAAACGVTNLAGVPHVYEMLDTLAPDWAALDKLKFVTQAGGRLSPRLVRKYADLGTKYGWEFIVMYGQTEASPRMAYLPGHLAATHPNSIGKAIPGGELALQDGEGMPIDLPGVEGELVYSGPNVMMGYAASADDLAASESPGQLKTGDLAVKDEAGLFYITGRKSRFVKLFGLRLSLDDIEAHLDAQGYTTAVVGNDQNITVFAEGGPDMDAVVKHLSTRYRLLPNLIDGRQIDRLPRLETGKTDYRALSALAASNAPRPSFLTFFRESFREFTAILTGQATEPKSVRQAFEEILGRTDLSQNDNFLDLGGDSTAFIELSLSLESYLGYLPMDWQTQSIRELESLGRRTDV
ncbi:MAG: non-ribosomal peptide synthetase, partial [Pseudomonadota bacterium]